MLRSGSPNMNNDVIAPHIHTATVTENTHVASDFYVVRFALTDPQKTSFRAGQYVTFHIGPPKQRHIMSIASPPTQNNSIEILQCVAPNGPGSHWAQALKPGDTTQFMGPLGRFTVNKEVAKRKVFIATGCGVAPLRSMILDYLSTGGKEQVVLYWGMRYIRDLFWQDELQKLTEQFPNFQLFMTLSKPENGWQGLRGRVTEHVFKNEQNLDNSEFYICGSRDMIREMRELLIAHNVSPEAIFNEVFF